jgi:hypothetical protein
MSRAQATGLRSRFEPTSDATILVALDRAERHDGPNPWDETGVYWNRLLEHLGFRRAAGPTRALRPRIEALIDAGLIVKTRNRGRERWGLTNLGRERVAQASEDGEADLPDSPQRREWKRAHLEASERIESIRQRVGSELHDALKLFEDGDGADSDAWYDVADRLKVECRRLGGATFCLHEWDEPDDEHPDLDDRSALNLRVRAGTSALFQDEAGERGE